MRMKMWFRELMPKFTKTCCKSVFIYVFELSDSHRPTSSNSVTSRRTFSTGEEVFSDAIEDLGSDATHSDEAQHSREPDEEHLPDVRYATLQLLSPWFPESDPEHERAQTFRIWYSRRHVVLWTCSGTAVAIFLVNFICTVYFHVKWGEESDVNAIYQGFRSRTNREILVCIL